MSPPTERPWRVKFTSARSDYDALGYVHSTEFIRYCLDGTADAAAGGALTPFKGDLFRFPLCQAEMLFQSEAEEDLVVSVWEDEDDGEDIEKNKKS